MSVIADKLQLTLATKENIKKAIENKGITVGDVPFSDYPSKIDSIGGSSDWKEPDWHDIINIRLMDAEDYQYKSIYLLDDTTDTIYLQSGDAYKTSDSNELILEDGEYTFTGEGDLECSKGYKTRWLIVYKQSINNDKPLGLNGILLYTIQDGITEFTSFENYYKLYYIDSIEEIYTIPKNCFNGCTKLRNISNLNKVTFIDEYAFANCQNFDQLTISDCQINGFAFANSSINELTLYNCVYQYITFVHTKIKKLKLKNIKNCIIPQAETVNIDDNSDISTVRVIRDIYYYYGDGATSTSSVSGKSLVSFIEYPTMVTLHSDNAESTNRLGFKEVTDSISTTAAIYRNNVYLQKLTLTGIGYISSEYRGFSAGSGCTSLKELNIVNDEYLSSLENIPMLSTFNAPNVKHITKRSLSNAASYDNLPNLDKFELENLETAFIYNFKNMRKLSIINFPKLHTLNIFFYADVNNQKAYVFSNLPNQVTINIPNATSINLSRYSSSSGYVYLFYDSFIKQVNLDNLTQINYGDTVSYSIDLYFFNHVAALKTLSIPKLTDILSSKTFNTYGGGAFCNMPDLVELNLPNLVNCNTKEMFRNLPNLEQLNVPKLEQIGYYFLSGNKKIKEFTINAQSNIKYAQYMFYESNIERVIFEEGYNQQYGSSLLFPPYSLTACPYLKYIYIPSSITYADGTNTSTGGRFGLSCPNLTTIELGQGYSKTLYLKHITTLTKECVVNMLNALADLTGQTKQTLYIYSTTLNLLSAEEKAIATNKNWTLSS